MVTVIGNMTTLLRFTALSHSHSLRSDSLHSRTLTHCAPIHCTLALSLTALRFTALSHSHSLRSDSLHSRTLIHCAPIHCTCKQYIVLAFSKCSLDLHLRLNDSSMIQ